MNTLRRALAALLSVVITSQASAASLYGSATRGPVTTIALPTVPTSIPQLPAAHLGLPSPLGALSAVPQLPGIQIAVAAPIAVAAKAVAAAATNSALPQAAAAGSGALKDTPSLRSGEAATPIAAMSQAQSAITGITAAASTFDNSGKKDGNDDGNNNSNPPAVGTQDPEGLSSFIEKASRLFHPSLGGQAPAIAVRGDATVAIPEGTIPTDPEMVARMQLSPLTNPEREAAVIKLYQEGGAAAKVVDVSRGQAPDLALYDTVQRQDTGRSRNNLIVVKQGRTDRIIVIGAHHDKVHEGQGTIDNWTGSTMLTNIYQAMKGVDTEATIIFVAFAREEEGLIGSEEFARSLSKQQLAKVDSMINMDTLGVDGTFSWKNNSTASLLAMIKRVAAAEKLDLTEATLNGGDADSSTFRRLRIAAMTIYGASEAVIFDIIHSGADNMAAFSLPHYRNAYLLSLALLKHLDLNPVKPAGTI